MTYYNEHEPFCVEWLGNLMRAGHIPQGHIDGRDIQLARAGDVLGYRTCHWFAGIGGWAHALDLAGWPADEPVWTASLPCQPFSVAGKKKGEEDGRHLWPHFRSLVAECRPATIFGEQVSSVDGREWLSVVRADLEEMGYAVGALDTCAAGEGAPHIRQRLYWVADCTQHGCDKQCGASRGAAAEGGQKRSQQSADCGGTSRLALGGGVRRERGERAEEGRLGDGEATGRKEGDDGPFRLGEAGPLGMAHRDERPGRQVGPERGRGGPGGDADARGGSGGDGLPVFALGHAGGHRHEGGADPEAGQGEADLRRRSAQPGGMGRYWDDCQWLYCRDGKWRPAKPGIQPLASRLPDSMGRVQPRLGRLASRNRTGRLRGYGNAIVPAVAATFIRAFMETR